MGKNTRLLAAAATISLVAACNGAGASITVNGHKVKDADKVVATLDSTFRQDTSTDTRANVGQAARCYLLDTGKGEVNTEDAFCGPVRRFGTKDGEVFDAYKLQAFTKGDAATLYPHERGEQSVAVPDVAKLIRPDGKKFAQADLTLAAPKAPAGDVNLFSESSELPDGRFDPLPTGGPGGIITPSVSVKVLGVSHPESVTPSASADSASSTNGDATSVSAPDGMLLSTYHIQVGEGAVQPDLDKEATNGGLDYTPTGSITVGTQHHSVASIRRMTATTTPVDDFITVVTPIGGTGVTLEVSIAGKPQSLDLATGKLMSDISVADYRTNPVQELNQQLVTATVHAATQSGATDISYAGTVTTAYVTGFDVINGWAPRGRAYLEVVGAVASFDSSYGYFTARETNSVYVAKGADGKPLRLLPKAGRNGTITWLVPDTLTGATISYTPHGAYGNVILGGGGSVVGKTTTIKISIPADGQPTP